MSSSKPIARNKEKTKGGKPAQVKGVSEIALEENKAFLKTLFTTEAAPLDGQRIIAVGVEPEKSVASAGVSSYNGTRVTNTVVNFGTSVDYLVETEGGRLLVVPQRFLSSRGNIHQDLFKVGDVVLSRPASCTKEVNIGLWSGQNAVGVRHWWEVYAWIPADKVSRAVKEGRVTVVDVAGEAAAVAAKAAETEAAAKAAQAAKEAADAAMVAALRAKKTEGEDYGEWFS